jgi:hypothetical protein
MLNEKGKSSLYSEEYLPTVEAKVKSTTTATTTSGRVVLKIVIR